MTDIVKKETRSRMMSGIRDRNTRIELKIRKALFSFGFRYRIHNKKLPGSPDLVFPKYKAVIQINGCFWHGHQCHLFKWPKTREDFWKQKIEGNIRRDERNLELLGNLGYRTLTIWECSIRGKSEREFNAIISEIEDWLIHSNTSKSIPE